MPIELPHKPVWEKRGSTILNSKTNEELDHDKTIHAGWNYRSICWNPCSPLSLEEQMSLTCVRADDDEGFQRLSKQLTALYRGLRVQAEAEEQEEEDSFPPQIKNQPERTEKLLDEWVLSHPPKNKRQITNDPLEEWNDWADKKLEWLSLSVEEEDNEEKNSETFQL